MIRWERVKGGIRKHHDWGYSEVFMPNMEDCFTPEEQEEVILELSELSFVGALPKEDQELFEKLKQKRGLKPLPEPVPINTMSESKTSIWTTIKRRMGL